MRTRPHARVVHAVAALVSIAGIAAAPPARAAVCDSEAWAFYGAVRDRAGRPVGDAQVYLLLDRMDAAGYARDGVRGRRFRTNAHGKYRAGLVCGDGRDAPNPCAPRPRVLTVAVSSRSHAMKLHVFKLKDLDVRDEEGVCFVQVPEIRLTRDP